MFSLLMKVYLIFAKQEATNIAPINSFYVTTVYEGVTGVPDLNWIRMMR